jgi:lipopolysaccharide biosynthesis regulator YciM
MIKASQFRGIDYKCAMMYFSNGEWTRAIKEFERITNESDPQIYEMLAKCYQRSGDPLKHEEFMKLAIASYITVGESDKAERLKASLGGAG